MANVIKIKRGLLTNLELATLQLGEPAFTTDEKALYVYDGANKIKVGKENVLGSGDNVSELTNNSDYTTNSEVASSYVPITRTVNGKSLSTDITLIASDVSAVPTTRTVNGKALSADITLTASDVGALTDTDIIDGGTF